MSPPQYLTVALSLLTLITAASTAPSNSRCRCLYGQQCWPDSAAFSALSRNLSQPLVQPTPAGAAGYSNATSTSCSEVTTNFFNSTWRSDQPGAYENINSEIYYINQNGTIDACYLSVTLGYPCKQGSIPPIGVDARTPQDVQLVNTGHDYQPEGRSSGRGAFMIWVHHMKDRTYTETFVPEGAPAHTIVAATVSSIRNFTDAGWGGYLYVLQDAVAGIWIAPNMSQSETEAAFTPYASYLYNATGGQGGAIYNSTSSFYEWFYGSFVLTSGQAGSSQVGGNVYIASRLLSREISPDDAAKTMLSVQNTVGLNVVGGGAVSHIDPSSTGLNPSWRHSLAEVYITESWDDGSNATVIQQAADNLKKSTDILEGVATDSGSYLNEGSLFERDFKKAFYGTHYSGLRAIKQKYDPNSLFVVPTGVASDEWDKDLTCHVA